jgi:hypothetical protein
MTIDFGKASDKFDAVMCTNGGGNDGMMGGGVFTVVCRDAEGNVKWEDSFHNLVPVQGLAYMNNSFFRAAGYTTTLYFGLITGPASGTSFLFSDTLAAHPGWTESTAVGSRKAISFTVATEPGTNVPSATTGTSTVFTVTSATTIAGAFVTNVASGTSPGVLFAEGDFAADKVVTINDTLAVTYTFSLASS